MHRQILVNYPDVKFHENLLVLRKYFYTFRQAGRRSNDCDRHFRRIRTRVKELL